MKFVQKLMCLVLLVSLASSYSNAAPSQSDQVQIVNTDLEHDAYDGIFATPATNLINAGANTISFTAGLIANPASILQKPNLTFRATSAGMRSENSQNFSIAGLHSLYTLSSVPTSNPFVLPQAIRLDNSQSIFSSAGAHERIQEVFTAVG